MSKPRITIVENSIDVTGALHSIMRSSRGLVSRFEFEVVIPEKSKLTSNAVDPFVLHRLPMREIRKTIADLLIYFPALIRNVIRFRKLINRSGSTLICNNDFYNLIPALYRMFGGHVPYICYVRFLPDRFPPTLVSFWCRLHLKYASKIIAVSDVVKRQLPAHPKVIVVHNELPEYEVPLLSAASKKKILCVSNYIRGKGQDMVIKSFAAVASKYPDWQLIFVGGDMGLEKNKAYLAALQSLTNELSIGDRVVFHRFSSDTRAYYQGASIVVNFSDSESFSLTCLEAMYNGRAVVATQSGGPGEIIEDQKTGLLIPVGDALSASIALEKLMAEDSFRERLGNDAYEAVRKKFSFDNTIGKLGTVYQEAINGI